MHLQQHNGNNFVFNNIMSDNITVSNVIAVYAINLCGGVDYVPWHKLLDELLVFESRRAARRVQVLMDLAAGLSPSLLLTETSLFEYLMVVNCVCLGLYCLQS